MDILLLLLKHPRPNSLLKTFSSVHTIQFDTKLEDVHVLKICHFYTTLLHPQWPCPQPTRQNKTLISQA